MSARYRAPRRRGHRGDPTAVLLVTEDDRFAVVLVLGRALWRHRSELAPVTTALTVAVAGAWTHAVHSHWAVPLAVLTATLVAVLAVPRTGAWVGTRLRAVALRPERLYAAAVLALAGEWLAAATAWGPGSPPLPMVAALGTVAGGIPWWANRRRRARVRVGRTITAWPTFADAVGLPGSRVVSAVVDRWGWRGQLALQRGQTAADATARAESIASALGVRPGAVRVEADAARADRAVVRVVESDPLARAVPWPGNRDAGTTEAGRGLSILDPVELGVFEDGSPVLVTLAYRNGLVGGVVGSGKSGVLNALLAALAACRDAVVWGIDLKGGLELGPWAPVLGRLATTREQAAAVLRDALAVREGRSRTSTDRLWRPARTEPALIVLVDEFAELDDEGKALADSLARTGRALMVNALIATQRPTQEAMGGGATRSQMDLRISLRVRERRDTDLILGQGMWAAGWRPDILDAPGKFLLSDPEHTVPRPARAYLVTDKDVNRITAVWAGHPPTLTMPEPPAEPPPASGPEPGGQHQATAATDPPDDPGPGTAIPEEQPEDLLWAALVDGRPEGVSVLDLIRATGMGRTWTYARLKELAEQGRATPTTTHRGYWRAIPRP